MQPPYDAVIFDMDGVVTDTATLHAAAWKQLFDQVLADPRARRGAPVAPFDPVDDYRRYVDGRRREDGVAAFLAARGIRVPAGAPGDPPDAWTMHGLGAHKNDLFLDLVATHGVRVFPGTVDLLHRLHEGRTPLGLVTASRNARLLLDRAGLGDAFAVVVDGNVADELDLPGKPDPATFCEAARRLGVAPARAAVVEDAVAGVQAARRGGFALVVAVDRAGQREALEAAGADFVLDDVAELDLGVFRSDPWLLVYEGFDPAHQAHREALTTLGNGYLATRGAGPEHVDDGVHYPGTYVAGVYDTLVSTVEGRPREDEELVNLPNWLPLDVSVADGHWWSEDGLTVTDERSVLDLREAVLTRTARLADGTGRELTLTQRRLVSMDRPHVAALETTLTATGWNGRLLLRSGIDTDVVNGNVAESHLLANRHFAPARVQRVDEDTLVAEVETSTSAIRIATAVRTTVTGGTRCGPPACGGNALTFEVSVTDGRPVVVTKVVAVTTSRDTDGAPPRSAALMELPPGDVGFAGLREPHVLAWRRLWDLFAVAVDTDDPVQLTVNLHVFHLLQTISPHTVGLDVGVPARGLHGEGYRGHVFWDQLFVLPLYVMRLPEVARALLDYRWRRLDTARDAASRVGLPGAMFPWQSGSDGRELTPRTLFNPRSQRWIPDNSWRQRHVGLAIAYNSWQYYQATGDTEWFFTHGAELVVEVARFFAGLATYDEEDRRFHIAGVMGPDEYHDGYPDAPGQGLRDNAYTNVLTAWVCARACDTVAALPGTVRDALRRRTGLSPDEPARWELLSTRLAVPFHDGLISQFDGYGDLAELDWDRLRRTYGNIERLDLILEAEGDSPNRYRLSKQADVLMLLYLLGPVGVEQVLAGLGYPLTEADLARAADYYLARTAHGSTLSRVVHTSVLSMLDRTTAWSEFREALDADLDDTQGGTTGHGVHLGAMAGTVDILLRTFAGIRMEAETLVFRPKPPGALRGLALRLSYRSLPVRVSLDRTGLHLGAAPAGVPPVHVLVGAAPALLRPGASLDFPIRPYQSDGRPVPATPGDQPHH